MPIPQRTVRVIALDPLMSSGQRIHTLYSTQTDADPTTAANHFITLLNHGTQETTYVLESGGVRFVNEVPYREYVHSCPWSAGTCTVRLTGDQYAALYPNGPWPCNEHIDIHRLLFDLIDPSGPDATQTKINNGQIHEVWIYVPLHAGFGEAALVSNPTDPKRYSLQDGLIEDGRISVDKMFIIHPLGPPSAGNLTEHYYHRIEGMMGYVFGPGGVGCGSVGSCNGWPFPWDESIPIQSTTTPWCLSEITDQAINHQTDLRNQGDAMIGWGHHGPHSLVGYVIETDGTVPTGAHLFQSYPTGFPVDLTRNDRRVYANKWSANYPSTDGLGSKNGFHAGWQFRLYPKGTGTDSSGRLNNWWVYFTNPNEQTGRGLAVQNPKSGPNNSARDLRLQVNYSGSALESVVLRWRNRPDNSGSFDVLYWDGGSWYPGITGLPGNTTSISVSPPAVGSLRAYLVVWYPSGGASKFSDVFSVFRINDADRLSAPPSYFAASLYQMNYSHIRAGYRDLPTHPSCEDPQQDPSIVPTCANWTRMHLVYQNPEPDQVVYIVRRRWSQTHTAMLHYQINDTTVKYYYVIVEKNGQWVGISDLIGCWPGNSTV